MNVSFHIPASILYAPFLLLSSLLMLSSSIFAADEFPSTTWTDLGGNSSLKVEGVNETPGRGGTNGSGHGPGVSEDQSAFDWKFEAACTALHESCEHQAEVMCPGVEDPVHGLVYRRAAGTTEWETVGFDCRSQAQMPEVEGPVFPGFTVEDVRRLPIVAPGVVAQPSPHTLKNAHTNFVAEAAPQQFTVDVVGFTVDVRAWPVSYTWDYGDGTASAPVTDPGRELPMAAVGERTGTSHVFTATGDYPVTLTTGFRAEFSVDGGPWQDVPGTAEVTSEPVVLSVWRAVTHHYADNCLVNPAGAGC